MKRTSLWIIALLVATGLCPAATAQIDERTDRQREVEIGRQVAREVERTMPLSRDSVMQERVRRIGAALIDSLPKEERAYSYEFKVLAQPEFNAFALPGGFMYVNEGLLARLPDDNAVAFVMAHEIAHAAQRHWSRQVRKNRPFSVLGEIFGAVTGQYAIAQLAHQIVTRKFSRAYETEADEKGVDILWRAGFDLNGAEQATEEVAHLDKDRGLKRYLSSHPRGSDRLKHVRTLTSTHRDRPRPAL